MRTTRVLTGGAAAVLLRPGSSSWRAAAAADDTPAPLPRPAHPGDSAAPTEAGTNFRTATEIAQGEQATASAPPATTCTGWFPRTAAST